MRALTTISIAMAMAVALGGQTRDPLTPPPRTTPQQPSQLRTQQVHVTVEGCVFGKTLLPGLATNRTADEAVLNASEFVLEGPRDLITQLTRNHDTHRERITGIATIPQPVGTTVETHGVTKGKTRVTSGTRVTESESGSAVALSAPLPVRLRVQAAEHVEDSCSPQPR